MLDADSKGEVGGSVEDRAKLGPLSRALDGGRIGDITEMARLRVRVKNDTPPPASPRARRAIDSPPIGNGGRAEIDVGHEIGLRARSPGRKAPKYLDRAACADHAPRHLVAPDRRQRRVIGDADSASPGPHHRCTVSK